MHPRTLWRCQAISKGLEEALSSVDAAYDRTEHPGELQVEAIRMFRSEYDLLHPTLAEEPVGEFDGSTPEGLEIQYRDHDGYPQPERKGRLRDHDEVELYPLERFQKEPTEGESGDDQDSWPRVVHRELPLSPSLRVRPAAHPRFGASNWRIRNYHARVGKRVTRRRKPQGVEDLSSGT